MIELTATEKTERRLVLQGTALTVLFGIILLLTPAHPAQAVTCGPPCVVQTELIPNQSQIDELKAYEEQQSNITRSKIKEHTSELFAEHKVWMMDVVFLKIILPALQKAAEQVSAVGLQQMMVIGAFIDAKHQLEGQRLFQHMSAQTYKDYTPSEGICTVATMGRSLGGTERNVDLTAAVLSKRALDRQTLKVNSMSTEGPESDAASRFALFQQRYCDRDDNTAGFGTICKHDSSVPLTTYNKDIDYRRTIGSQSNLNIDFSNTTATDDEKDVFALETNLYAHDLSSSLTPGQLKAEGGLDKLLDARSIIAKRSVAENSFQSIAAMKSTGQTSVAMTAKYLQAALVEMGISATDAAKIIGDNPSYYAQMEVLTKKMFQRPEFFVDLYDKPANVERKSVALQAVTVMQRRDIFKSALRTEAMLSLLLELDVMQAQKEVQNAANAIK